MDKRLVPDLDLTANTNQQHRLVSILQAYEEELDRVRQMIRTNEETVGFVLIENDLFTSVYRFVPVNENWWNRRVWPVDGE